MFGCNSYFFTAFILTLNLFLLESVVCPGRTFGQTEATAESSAPATADGDTAAEGKESSTFTEMMRSRDEKDFKAQQESQSSALRRAKNYGVLPEDTDPQLANAYKSAYQAFCEALLPVRALYLRHQVAWEATNDKERMQDFSKASAKAQEALEQWCRQMAKTYATDPAKFGGLGDMMEEMILVDSARDSFEAILPLAKILWEKDEKHSDDLLEAIGYTGFAMNDFDLAESAWTKLSEQKFLPGKIRFLLQSIPDLTSKWEREQKFREEDAKSSSNPQVLVVTNRGEILIELFEDQAPQAVANFIFLVERGFYNRKTFFRVLEHFLAQTGCDRGDGTGNAGYGIPDETKREDRRDVFRGSLMFAIGVNDQTKEPNLESRSSQIQFAMMPAPQLGDNMVAFGRIIEGEQSLGLFARMDLSDEEQKKNKHLHADFILDARVVRKRDHKYIPEISAGRLP